MVSASLIFTKYHDQLTILSSVFGLYVLIVIIKATYHSNMDFFKITGAISLILLGLNNVIYYSSLYIEWLPLVQKFTILIVLIWIIGMNHEIMKKHKLAQRNINR